jgi:hypothetical protein
MKGNSSVADYREKDRIDGKDAGSFSTGRKLDNVICHLEGPD